MRSWRAPILGLSLLLLALTAWALPDAWWSPHDSLERQMINCLGQANERIDLALYEFSSRPLAQALSKADHRGVFTRLVVDCRAAKRLPDLPFSTELRCAEGRSSEPGLMHNKFALLDRGIVVTGSF